MAGFAFTLDEIRKTKNPEGESDDVIFRISIDPNDKVDFLEMSVPRFCSSEGVVSWLRWLKKLETIREVKSWANKPDVTHAAIKLLLKGNAREIYVENFTDQADNLTANGSTNGAITNQKIDSALFEITKSFFFGLQPRSSIKHFLGTVVKPPDMTITEFYLAFKEVLSFIPYVSHSAESITSTSIDYTSEELYFLFSKTLPENWKSDFESTGRPLTMKALVQYCQIIEGVESNKQIIRRKLSLV